MIAIFMNGLVIQIIFLGMNVLVLNMIAKTAKEK